MQRLTRGLSFVSTSSPYMQTICKIHPLGSRRGDCYPELRLHQTTAYPCLLFWRYADLNHSQRGYDTFPSYHSEGYGMFMLKCLSDATAESDNILDIIVARLQSENTTHSTTLTIPTRRQMTKMKTSRQSSWSIAALSTRYWELGQGTDGQVVFARTSLGEEVAIRICGKSKDGITAGQLCAERRTVMTTTLTLSSTLDELLTNPSKRILALKGTLHCV